MRFFVLLLAAMLAPPVSAQVAAPGSSAQQRTSVSGVVTDSVSGSPLTGATVQLVSADNVAGAVRTGVSDSLGWFMFEEVPRGRYLLGFLHPMLDSLGVEPPVRDVTVAGAVPLRFDLAIPSPGRLRAAICGARTVADSGAVITGVVRDARDLSPLAGVTVTGEWLEFAMSRDGYTRRTERVVATTAGNGWFALCDAPSPGTTAVVASRGADSTGRVEVVIASERFVRRDLYLGPSYDASPAPLPGPADTLAAPQRRLRTGDGRLEGRVVAAVGGGPLAGARVQIVDGPETRTNADGGWTIADAPPGTRTLDVRAVGYYPVRRVVNVVPGAPAVHVALSTLTAVLDTVRVTASVDRLRSGFTERRRMGLGRFLGPTEIARHAPVNASDIFRVVAGVSTQGEIKVRGGTGECTPSLYIDGRLVLPETPGQLAADDIDNWVRPEEIAGVEVYSDVVPPQFNPGLSGCGAIVIWTK